MGCRSFSRCRFGFFRPGIGTAIGGVVGGLFGAFAGGSAAGKVASAVTDEFIEDDAKEMVALLKMNSNTWPWIPAQSIRRLRGCGVLGWGNYRSIVKRYVCLQ